MPSPIPASNKLFWVRHLRNAAALARLRVLTCLKEGPCYDVMGAGAGGDVTKQFDLVAEHTMVEYVKRFTAFTLVSEEAGTQPIGNKPTGFLIMDPIDGSTNVSHNISFACIAIAYASDLDFSSIKAAVVMDLFSGFCYHAVQGGGAFRDTQRIRPAETSSVISSLVGVDTPFPPKISRDQDSSTNETGIRFTRHYGANALELCFVADGSLDGFIDLRGVFRGTDLAAAYLILQEAGAALIDQKGVAIAGKCTNDAQYAYIAARDESFAATLLTLASRKL